MPGAISAGRRGTGTGLRGAAGTGAGVGEGATGWPRAGAAAPGLHAGGRARREGGRAPPTRRRAGHLRAGAAGPGPASWNFREGLLARLEADPRFPFKLGTEMVVDQILCGVANATAYGFNPMLWSAGQLGRAVTLHFTGIINDTVLVWNLAPRTERDPGAPPPQEGAVQLQHCFQEAAGATLADRLGCYWQKLAFYSVLGIGTGLLSHSLSMAALGKSVQVTTLGWVALIGALHLGASGNTRYQLLNGLELLAEKTLPRVLLKPTTVVLRLSNNLLGGRIFLILAAWLTPIS